MFLCHARSPLLVVQEYLKTFNAGQAFETQPELPKIFTDSHFHLDKLLDKLKVNTLNEVQDKHQQDHSLDFAIEDYVYHEKWYTNWHDIKPKYDVHYRSSSKEIFYPKLIFSSKHLETSQESKMCWCR